jgi:tetraacyldisaccharide 4'-kinase
MSFNFYLFRGLRLLLFPVSVIAGLYITLRNWMYDRGYINTTSFNMPIICVGNLSMGGTGKSPMTEYLLRLLTPRYEMAVLSRGYKRKTKGYMLAGQNTTALEIGDEPMQFYKKFPEAAVAVGEERIEAIPQLLHDRPETKAIILDDAFQHRAIKAGLNIVLTDFSNPYWHDTYFPTGELRDNRKSAGRANIIIVTKCPPDLSETVRSNYLRRIRPGKEQKVYFTSIEYGVPYHIISLQETELSMDMELLLVCGIANPVPLKNHLEASVEFYIEKNYNDHHIFSIDDWNEIVEKFKDLEGNKKIILTTEKDAVRLEKFGTLLQQIPLYVMPITHGFLFGEQAAFDLQVKEFIEGFAYVPITR